MTMTNASSRPNTAATTPNIEPDTSAWNPSRVTGTARLISQTASTVTASDKQTAATMITPMGTVFSSARSTDACYFRADTHLMTCRRRERAWTATCADVAAPAASCLFDDVLGDRGRRESSGWGDEVGPRSG
jgi:hypothetical protein